MTPRSLPTAPATEDLPLQCWREGGIARLRFNRPQALNTIDFAMARAFNLACHDLAADPEVRVVIVTGAGRAFMAGGDLVSMRTDPVGATQELITQMHAGLGALAAVRAPVVAGLHGAVAGAGLGIALACDLALAADDARFNIAYPRIGASTDCGTSYGLVRAVGVRKALEIALLCEPFDVAEALRLGLVNRIVPAAQLEEELKALASRLEAGPPLALTRLKRLLHDAAQRDLAAQLQAEAQAFGECALSEDFVEGMAAFMERRPPVFRGR